MRAKLKRMARNTEGNHPTLTKLRKLCKRLPETAEVEAWGHPTFRVRNKIFAGFGTSEGGASVGCKQTHVDQAALVKDPRFSVAKYVGRYGWISIDAEKVQWSMIEDLVLRSYRLIAPKTLAKQV